MSRTKSGGPADSRLLDANANAVVRLAKRGVSDYEGNVDAHCVVRAALSRGRERRVARADLVEGKGTISEELLKKRARTTKMGRLQMIAEPLLTVIFE